MLDKTLVFSICFLLTNTLPINSQSVNVKSKSDQDFAELTYDFLTKQFVGDNILIILNVKDRLGNFVSGMANPQKQHQYFTALLDSNEREICKDFTVTEATMESSPVAFYFSLVLDYSNSTKKIRPNLRSAADKFIKSMPKAYFTRINFDESVDRINSTPTPYPILPSEDQGLKYGGKTALIAATDAGIKTLEGALGARFVILFAEGEDNASGRYLGEYATTPYELVANAKDVNASIYTIGINIKNQSVIPEICSSTGGKYFNVGSVKDIESMFDSVRTANFTNFYIIRAKCKDTPVAIMMTTPNGTIKNKISFPTYPSLSKNLLPIALGYYGKIYFDSLKFDIRKVDQKILSAIADSVYIHLKENQNLKIQIQGHASPDGTEDANNKISEYRALNAKNYIKDVIEKKCGKCSDITDRIIIETFGHTVPLYPDKNDPRYKENRRVEIWILQ